eukprot:1423856-Prymnesium_polylepis.1
MGRAVRAANLTRHHGGQPSAPDAATASRAVPPSTGPMDKQFSAAIADLNSSRVKLEVPPHLEMA